jgi:hypothetical protein
MHPQRLATQRWCAGATSAPKSEAAGAAASKPWAKGAATMFDALKQADKRKAKAVTQHFTAISSSVDQTAFCAG